MPYTVEDIEKLKRAVTVPGVMEEMIQRWSPRAFAEKPVSDVDLRRIFEAAHWAASSFNEQPWRFFVGRKGDETYAKIFDSLLGFNQAWAGQAPVLILSVGKKTFSHNGSPNRYGLHDTGAATAYLVLQSVALGLRAHSMGGFDHEKARAAFSIPDDYELGAVTALGYFGDPDTLPEKAREQELAPRTRKPLSEIVFTDWEKPARL